jgi:hypothetical protein
MGAMHNIPQSGDMPADTPNANTNAAIPTIKPDFHIMTLLVGLEE